MGLMEKISSRLERLELPLSLAGWVALIGLMLYLTALDISRIVGNIVA